MILDHGVAFAGQFWCPAMTMTLVGTLDMTSLTCPG